MEPMKPMERMASADFYFIGASILPPIIALVDIGLAILVFVFLLLAGAICSIADPGAPHNR